MHSDQWNNKNYHTNSQRKQQSSFTSNNKLDYSQLYFYVIGKHFGSAVLISGIFLFLRYLLEWSHDTTFLHALVLDYNNHIWWVLGYILLESSFSCFLGFYCCFVDLYALFGLPFICMLLTELAIETSRPVIVIYLCLSSLYFWF